MRIHHSLEGEMQLFVVEHISKPPYRCFAYVVAMERRPPGQPPYANYVIVCPQHAGLPRFLFGGEFSLEGMPYAKVVAMAIEAYSAEQPDLPVLTDAEIEELYEECDSADGPEEGGVG